MKMNKKQWGFLGLGGLVTSIIGYMAYRKQRQWNNLQNDIDTIPYEIKRKKDRRASPIWTTKFRGRWYWKQS